ncbi:uncharacterized protein [Malus domestica]|uniref:uncharacterized protein n=1 Tax=Malus domestica TaxID=3750 RepID=UPI0010AB46F1|nr:uncharacterized protein LOC114822312 [Malus domestica]
MTLYANNDALMCKIFATTLQGKTQDWFHTLPPRSIRNFNELSLVFTKEYSSYRSIRKKFDHLFNMKKDPNESFCTYIKRFKVKKAKIVKCDDSIVCSAFRKGHLTDHPLFKKLIMGGELTLAALYALAKKHALWDEAKQSEGNEQKNKRKDRSLNRGDAIPKVFTKSTVLIGQILRKLKNEPWFKLPPPMKGDLTKLDQTKYYAFH